MNSTIKIFIAAISILALGSCNKKNSDFYGKDTIIFSFQLEQDGTIVKASISGDSIILTAPDNFIFPGAKATVKLSENASMSPDPSMVTDWETSRYFLVRAYNGTEKRYYYKTNRRVVSTDGDVLLTTQAEVDAFGALHIGQINGNLVIGNAQGSDSIRSLKPLADLKAIHNDLVINGTFAGKDFEGLEKLETAASIYIGPERSTSQVGPKTRLQSLSLPKLKSLMGGLYVNGALVKLVSLPELTKINNSLQLVFVDSLEKIEMPKLESVLQDLRIEGTTNNRNLQVINFPALKTIGDILLISQFSQLNEVRFPALTKTISLEIRSFPALTVIEAPLLQSLTKDATFTNNPLLKTLDLSSLKTVDGSLFLTSAAVENLNGLKSLVTVGVNLSLTSLPSLTNISGLKSLRTVGSTFTFTNCPNVQNDNLDALSSLNKVGNTLTITTVPFTDFTGFNLADVPTINLDCNNINTVSLIDVSRLNTSNMTIRNVSTAFGLKGKDIFPGSLTLVGCGNQINMDGFQEMVNFSYQYTPITAPITVQTLNLSKVTGNFSITAAGFTKISLPYLEEVTGNYTATINSKMILEQPALKKTGRLTLSLQQSNMDLLSLPLLESINGDCTFTTGNNTNSVGDIQLPSLTQINGILRIAGQSATLRNTRMLNLNGFSSLVSATGVTVMNSSVLVDFTGLKNVFRAFPASAWSVSGNSYNPTYQDMLDGKYVKP